jgi:hypothetical protein
VENKEDIDKFLDAHDQQKLKQKDINNLNRSIISNEIEIVIKNLPTKKSPSPNRFITDFYQIFKIEHQCSSIYY